MTDYPVTQISNYNSLTETTAESQNIQVLAENVDHYVQAIFDQQMSQRKGFFERFFPSVLQQTIEASERKLLQTKYDGLVEASTTLKNTQIQSLKERANHYLNQRKAQLRAETASFLVAKAQELEAEIDKTFDEFVARVETRAAKNEQIKVPFLKRKMEKQLEKDIEGFLQIKEQVVHKFRRIVEEGV